MSKLDDMREDIRLAHLNNQSYRFMFGVFKFLKGLMTLVLVGCFAVGIWYITYGFENRSRTAAQDVVASAAAPEIPQPAPPIPVASMQSTEGSDQVELSAEQVAALREFAKNNRTGNNRTGNNTTVEITEPPIALARAEPATQTIPELLSTSDAGNDVTNLTSRSASAEIEATLPDISARSVLAELEAKLGKESLADSTQALDTLPPLAETPIIQASTVEPALPATVEPAPVVEGAPIAEDFSVVQDDAWVLAQKPDSFVIQVGSTTNKPFLVSFEKRLPATQPTAIFEMLIGKSPEHTLTFGLFETRGQATQALGRLSQSSRRYGAYVRKISAVQKQIRDLGADLAVAQTAGN